MAQGVDEPAAKASLVNNNSSSAARAFFMAPSSELTALYNTAQPRGLRPRRCIRRGLSLPQM
jgi:hypothetical protein